MAQGGIEINDPRFKANVDKDTIYIENDVEQNFENLGKEEEIKADESYYKREEGNI